MANIQFLLLLLNALIILISPTQGALQKGFTTDLIHRDSPLSPFHNPSLDKWQRVRKSFHRSISRVNYLSHRSSLVASNGVQAPVSGANGEYVMEVFIGTPPVRQFGIVDTGSDLIWTQCQPCLSCYKQALPIFDPRKSNSYKIQSCESKGCRALKNQGSCTRKDTCLYQYAYGDQSHTVGDLATDTITFNSNSNASYSASFRNVTLGCGHDNAGTFSEAGSGLIGLGGGALSLVSQLSSSAGGKFSHCLIPFFEEGNFTSKINFGKNAVVSGPGVVSTPLLKGDPDTFYYLNLEGISVDKVKIPISNRKLSYDYANQEGNIIIDSGTTLNFLPSDIFSELTEALTDAIKGKQVDDPSGNMQLCYQDTEDLNIPNLTAHFTDADVELKPVNTFVKVSKDMVCLAMLPTQDVAIFGNVAQSNFLVGYDIEGGKVSFKPVDCTKGY